MIGFVASAAGALLLLLLLIGAVCIICKRRNSVRKPIKMEVNPVYGEDSQRDQKNEDYDYMG